MDYLRACYKSSMRVFRDNTHVLVPGAWHWCPPGAVVVPYSHPYRSTTWDAEGIDYSGQLGEDLPRGEWTDGARDDRLDGQHWCGSGQAWEEGSLFAEGQLPVDPQGQPLCCNLRPVEPSGDMDGGEGLQGLETPTTITFAGCATTPTTMFWRFNPVVFPSSLNSVLITLDFDGVDSFEGSTTIPPGGDLVEVTVTDLGFASLANFQLRVNGSGPSQANIWSCGPAGGGATLSGAIGGLGGFFVGGVVVAET